MTNEISSEQTLTVPQGSTLNTQFDVTFPASTFHGQYHSLIVDNSEGVEINYNYSVIETIGNADRAIENESGSIDGGAVTALPLGVLRDKLLFHFMPTADVSEAFDI